MRRSIGWTWLAALGAACAWANVQPDASWSVVRSEHFEVYSQSDVQTARAALLWFEQLRTFFEQSGFPSKDGSKVRVIGFRSAKEYGAYRLRSGADAYYLGTDARDYIVMPSVDAAEFVTAAHEYTHLQLHANGLALPLWLSEGLAEFFSTVRIAQSECYVGGELSMRANTLRHTSWMPLRDLIEVAGGSAVQTNRRTAALFYAQSWALTEMLVVSPNYAPRFREAVAEISAGAASAEALTKVYGKSLNEIAADLRRWVDGRKFRTVRLPGVVIGTIPMETHTLQQAESNLVLADLVMAEGQLDRAEALYGQLSQISPNRPEIWAALGGIALRKGDAELARANWKRAIESGVEDAQLCYRYATLADNAGLGANEIRPALLRAVALKPDFDDARFQLALLESNAGRFEEALAQLKAMRNIAAGRGFGYWSAMSYACEELGRRDEAQSAAEKALKHANTSDERENARRLAYMAATDFGVQFARDANGQLQLVTARVPHNSTHWNPFVEPGDQIRRVEGKLQAINCSAGKATGVVIEAAQGLLQLAIADAGKVEMRNAPREFSCGSQAGESVSAEYAASIGEPGREGGLLRGLEFR